jgi:hypothetical protein
MRKRWLMQTGLSGASRWSAVESILGGGIFKRNYGEFSTGVDRTQVYDDYVPPKHEFPSQPCSGAKEELNQ